MTDVQIVAFIVTPLMGVAVGWGVALWSLYADRPPTPRRDGPQTRSTPDSPGH